MLMHLAAKKLPLKTYRYTHARTRNGAHAYTHAHNKRTVLTQRKGATQWK